MAGGQVVVGQVLRRQARGGQDHRLDHVDADDLGERLRAGIDREIDLLFLQPGHAFLVDGRGQQGLALEVAVSGIGADVLEGTDDQVRLGDLLGQERGLYLGQLRQHRAQRPSGPHAAGHLAAGREQFELIQRSQHLRRTGLQHRIGELQVRRVLLHFHGEVVVDRARQEQHQVVVEIAAQRLLHVPDRAHLQHPAQVGAGGGRHTRHDVEQLVGVLVDEAPRADVVMVADHAQSDRVGIGLGAAQQVPSLAVVSVGPLPRDLEVLAQELGLERVILVRRTQ